MEQIHDYLMEAYYSVRYNQPIMARWHLGCATALIKRLEPTDNLNFLFHYLHYLRSDIKTCGIKESTLEGVSRQVRKVSEWRAA